LQGQTEGFKMSALQDEIKAAVQAATAPLFREITALRELIEQDREASRPEFMTVKQAASFLSCSEKTVHRYCNIGRLEVKRLGRKKLIRYSTLIQAQR
jgi:excisionase family DNA binding protein